ncbi:hypothetical protein LOTGIDRAFT_232056 [Lottia gigantea]|uniref:TLC domain-containing protein n=1 Tax=Lottia gigantea TaxID=225164 RepID=V4AP28_LOTGI|nr:hypothetical protein LOTGIDRAFT_232056 [Lottia gigantea]ESO95371.1 hypothetical protein LOTGIDRAFT_232056 [Lottia gigantea]
MAIVNIVTASTGLLFFISCYLLTQKVLNKHFTANLNKHDIANVSEKIVCSIQAVCSCIAGFIIARSCHDVIYDQHWLSNGYACFALPYFIFDCWAMYTTHYHEHQGILKHKDVINRLYHFVINTKLLLIHHVVFPIIFFPILMFIRGGKGDFFVGVFYMIEITVPFISARQIMLQLKLTDYPSYSVVGLSMIAVFFISRILVFPYLYFCYAKYAKISFLDVFTHIPVKCNIGCLALLLPQIYWLSLMIKGAIKFFTKPKFKLNGSSFFNKIS